MDRTSSQKPDVGNQSTAVITQPEEGEASEAVKRVTALYSHAHGPLIAWMQEQARARGDTAQEMCKQLGVTFGYIAQLRSGHRKLSGISDDFATACARYLGVPTIVVKLLAGRISLQDFDVPSLTQEEVLRLAVIRMQSHPRARELLTVDPTTLPLR
jgi:transcriptional regulator with XRE-family HTH domain